MAEKIAIVTGAGTGIGKAVSLALLKDGFVVVLAGRRREPLDDVARANAGKTLVVPTDVTKPAEVAALFAKTKEAYGRLDLLFNNAGILGMGAPLEDLSYEHWTAHVATNLTGAFLCTQEAFRIMKAQTPRGGRIINNGSIAAHSPRPNTVAYTATKHAITGLTKSTSLEGRPYDIACGQIDIGNAATGPTERMAAGTLQPSGQMMKEPRMNVDDVGRAVSFMAGLPLDANVQFMTVMATKMPLIGRG